MASRRHVIPTHLSVVDKPFYGLAVRQVLLLLAGVAAGYGLAAQLPGLAVVERIAIGAICSLVALLAALIRPQGRGLEEWAIVLLRYSTIPKIAVWSPVEPRTADWRAPDAGWVELHPGAGKRAGARTEA